MTKTRRSPHQKGTTLSGGKRASNDQPSTDTEQTEKPKKTISLPGGYSRVDGELYYNGKPVKKT